MSNRPVYAFLGHHKCATMWLEGICRMVCQRLGLRYGVVYNEDHFDRDLPGWIASGGIEFFLYGSADIEYTRQVENLRGVHIVRDPRDITVSAYYSHLKSHSTKSWEALPAHREKLRSLDKDAGLEEEIRFRGRSFGHMASWDYGQPNVLEIRFEDIVRGSYETLLDAFGFLGLVDDTETYDRPARFAFLARDVINRIHARSQGAMPFTAYPRQIPGPELLAVGWHHRFQRRSKGRARGTEDTGSHYRKGQPGDWRRHFTEAHKTLFKSLYPGLVPGLGYADSDDW